MAKNRVFETMTFHYVQGAHVRVRVWREEPKFKRGPDKEVVGQIEEFCERTKLMQDIADWDDWLAGLSEHICKLPRISAVEILDSNSCGSLEYPDWR